MTLYNGEIGYNLLVLLVSLLLSMIDKTMTLKTNFQVKVYNILYLFFPF